MSPAGQSSSPKRRAVLRTAWALVAVAFGIYALFVGRAFWQGGL